MMYLALSYDHRIVDGKEAVTFLVRVKECLEDPQRFILDVETLADNTKDEIVDPTTSSSSAPGRAATSAPSAPRSSG